MTGVKSDSISEKTTERSVLRFFSPLIATIYDGIHLPDIDGVAGGIFSLRLVGSQYPEEQGTWLELPTTDLGFQWVLNRLNERTFDDCIIAESISTVQRL